MGIENQNKKDVMIIDAQVLKRLKIRTSEVVEYIENKKASDMKPIHVMAHQYWKNHPAVASS